MVWRQFSIVQCKKLIIVIFNGERQQGDYIVDKTLAFSNGTKLKKVGTARYLDVYLEKSHRKPNYVVREKKQKNCIAENNS